MAAWVTNETIDSHRELAGSQLTPIQYGGPHWSLPAGNLQISRAGNPGLLVAYAAGDRTNLPSPLGGRWLGG
jgi:hypothetical protein